MISYVQTRSQSKNARSYTDASTTFPTSSPPTDLRSVKVAPFGRVPNATVLRTSALVSYDLRSSTPKEHEVHLDFDESTRAWTSNKRSIGNGCYTYLVDEPVVERPKRMRRSPVRYQV